MAKLREYSSTDITVAAFGESLHFESNLSIAVGNEITSDLSISSLDKLGAFINEEGPLFYK